MFLLWMILASAGLFLPEVLPLCPAKDHMYPFGGTESDDLLDDGDDGPSGTLTMSTPFNFFGESHTDIWVNINGPISFGEEFLRFRPTTSALPDHPYLAAFWHDISLKHPVGLPMPTSNIWYRTSTDPTLLSQAGSDILLGLGENITPTEVAVVTWDAVSFVHLVSPPQVAPQNTFQVVLVTDGVKSFAIFNYQEIGWTWIEVVGRFAVAVFNKGQDSGEVVNLRQSGTARMSDLVVNTNVGVPGRIIVRTDPSAVSVRYNDVCCVICSDPLISTTDGGLLWIKNAQSTLLSEWNVDDSDSCKFTIIGVSSLTSELDDLDEPLFLDWISVGIHVHDNPSSGNLRNLILGQSTATITERGLGVEGDHIVNLPYSFPAEDEDGSAFTQSLTCDPLYTVSEDPVGSGVIKLRSDCCPFSLDWVPDGRNTCASINVDAAAVSGTLGGICGNANGGLCDDWSTCAGEPCEQNTAGCATQISDGCIQNEQVPEP